MLNILRRPSVAFIEPTNIFEQLEERIVLDATIVQPADQNVDQDTTLDVDVDAAGEGAEGFFYELEIKEGAGDFQSLDEYNEGNGDGADIGFLQRPEGRPEVLQLPAPLLVEFQGEDALEELQEAVEAETPRREVAEDRGDGLLPEAPEVGGADLLEIVDLGILRGGVNDAGLGRGIGPISQKVMMTS